MPPSLMIQELDDVVSLCKTTAAATTHSVRFHKLDPYKNLTSTFVSYRGFPTDTPAQKKHTL